MPIIVRRSPFPDHGTLRSLTPREWEALCDRCGRCCLHKLGPPDGTREVYYTNVACRFLDDATCRCTAYEERSQVANCLIFTPETVDAAWWLPPTCAYRILALGLPLPAWHPLISGDPESVHRAGISIRGKTFSETEVPEGELADHLVEWI